MNKRWFSYPYGLKGTVHGEEMWVVPPYWLFSDYSRIDFPRKDFPRNETILPIIPRFPHYPDEDEDNWHEMYKARLRP